MTVYIDNWFGKPFFGYSMKACVMYSEDNDLKGLRRIAKEIGLKKIMERKYYDGKVIFYFVSESKRDDAIGEGAIEVESNRRNNYFKKFK